MNSRTTTAGCRPPKPSRQIQSTTASSTQQHPPPDGAAGLHPDPEVTPAGTSLAPARLLLLPGWPPAMILKPPGTLALQVRLLRALYFAPSLKKCRAESRPCRVLVSGLWPMTLKWATVDQLTARWWRIPLVEKADLKGNLNENAALLAFVRAYGRAGNCRNLPIRHVSSIRCRCHVMAA